MTETRGFRTRIGWRQPPVKDLQALVEAMSSRESASTARAKIQQAIDVGGDIDLTDEERREVVADIRLAMQHGQVHPEIAGIRHDEA